ASKNSDCISLSSFTLFRGTSFPVSFMEKWSRGRVLLHDQSGLHYSFRTFDCLKCGKHHGVQEKTKPVCNEQTEYDIKLYFIRIIRIPNTKFIWRDCRSRF